MKKPRTLHQILVSENYKLVHKVYLENVAGNAVHESMDPIKISSKAFELATDADTMRIKNFCIIPGSLSLDILTALERANLKRGDYYLFYTKRK